MDTNFEIMLENIYSQLIKKKKTSLNLPNLIIENSPTKLYWRNITEYLNIINRDHDHFYNYIKSQYSDKDINWYSSNKSDGLIIHGKFLKNNIITNIFNKYVNTFVICNSCKHYNTILIKKNCKTFYFKCNECGTNYYIK